MRVDNLSSGLSLNSEGIYVASSKLVEQAVSYAADGHQACFQIEDRSFWFRHRNACISALVRRFPAHGPILDVGGGNGFVAKKLMDDGHEVVLLEPGMEGARNARLSRGVQHVICATLEDANLQRESFGAIGLFDVIEHVEHDAEFLVRLCNLLQPAGRIYLTVPCHPWLWSSADTHAGHFRRHTKATLASLLEPQFRIDYFSYYFAPLVLPQLLLRALPHRLGLKREETLLAQEREHASEPGFASRLLTNMLRPEIDAIAAGRQLRYGASALIAATRR